MNQEKKLPPREVSDRESRYMGLAFIHSSFSKDPNTQVGAQIVDKYNNPLGSGYNGPPASIPDDSFSWARPPKDNPDAFSKYDVVVHAEINAIEYSCDSDLSDATLYVTAYPCKDCMLILAKKQIGRIIYFDQQSDSGSMLRKQQRKKSEKIANMASITMEKFRGNLNWLPDWVDQLRSIGIFEM